MINEQVFIWIARNSHVYMRNWKGDGLEPQKIVGILREINKEGNKTAWKMLRDRQQVTITNFITLFIQKDKKDGQFRPHYDLNPDLKLLVNDHSSKKAKVDEEAAQNYIKEVCSALMLEKEVVSQLLAIFGCAIRDLVANGHSLSLNFEFCRINISKKQCRCLFSKAFLKDLYERQPQKENRPLKLYLCPTLTCTKQGMFNITQQTRMHQDQKWTQIKQGNLYTRPSLVQIKQLFDKGMQLQLRYKDYFRH